MQSVIKSVTALGFIVCLIAMPQVSGEACKDSLEVCINVLFPSLFPFFVLSDIFITSGGADFMGRYFKHIMKPLFKINGNGSAALVLGMISGYPLGAKITQELRISRKISDNEGKRLVCFTNNCGPMFIIGALGAGMLSSKGAGIMLCIIHILSSITLGLILRRFGSEASAAVATERFLQKQSSFSDAVENSMASVIRISAFVVFFAVVMGVAENLGIFDIVGFVLAKFGIKESISVPLAQSLIEMTTGLKKLSASDNALSHKLIASSFVLGWSGISVIFQSRAVSESLGIKLWQYALARFTHGCIGAFYTYIAMKLPLLSQAVSYEKGAFAISFNPPKIGVIMTVLFGMLYIIFVGRSKDKRQDSIQRRTTAK